MQKINPESPKSNEQIAREIVHDKWSRNADWDELVLHITAALDAKDATPHEEEILHSFNPASLDISDEEINELATNYLNGFGSSYDRNFIEFGRQSFINAAKWMRDKLKSRSEK